MPPKVERKLLAMSNKVTSKNALEGNLVEVEDFSYSFNSLASNSCLTSDMMTSN